MGVAKAMQVLYDQNHMLPPPFQLLADATVQRLDPVDGEVLFREGEPTNGIYISVDAEVHLVRVGPSGEPITIHRSTAGNSFAEASVFTERFHCDAVVRVSGQVIRIPRATVLAGFQNPDFALAYNRLMSRQVQSYRQLLETVSIKSAKERVYAAMVAGLLKGSVMAFSSRIALTHEATYRALRTLERDGRISNPERGVYVLTDQPADP